MVATIKYPDFHALQQGNLPNTIVMLVQNLFEWQVKILLE
jgi:hypothetical protein